MINSFIRFFSNFESMYYLLFIGITIFFAISANSINSVFGQNNNTTTNEETLSFSIEIPDDWIYEEYSDFAATQLLGFGPVNAINLTPNELYDDVINNKSGVWGTFKQDTHYGLKNAPLERYEKYQIERQETMKVTSVEKSIIDGEKAFKIYADGIMEPDLGHKILEYIVIHKNEPYFIGYEGDVKNYKKYLSTFEQIVKSFKFID
jgi:hypothetical protein